MNDNSSTTNLWLSKTTRRLAEAHIEMARLDALVILGDVTGKSRAHLLAHPELELTAVQEKELQKLLNRRIKHEPLAYLRNKVEFYGRELAINSHVLVPRPESEAIIELLKAHHKETNFSTVVDVGTGSGALAITAALELPSCQVFGLDIDQKCLEIASRNATSHEAKVDLRFGNLLEPLSKDRLVGPIALLANLPYVPDDYQINQAAKHEPKLALFGGKDGLDLYRAMFDQFKKYSNKSIFVFTESLDFQHDELMNIARAQHYKEIANEGLVQVFSNR